MGVVIAFVPVAAGARLSRAAFAADLATWENMVDQPRIEKQDKTLSFSYGDRFAVVGMMPASIPADELEGPVATSWLWPDAEMELAAQRGHLLVTVGSTDESDDPIALRKFLTQVVASVLATTDQALGVYVGEAGMVVSRELYLQIAREMLPRDVPLPLWIDFRVGPVDFDSGLSYGFTDGLEELGHMELVTENASESPGELRERMMSLADYLLSNGPVIRDGHTVGADSEEKITVRYRSSPFGHDSQVMGLDYSTKRRRTRNSTKQKRSWFSR
ncbi:DUF4261 domain-containing protein [Aeoliella mucimassa]|uniref:DUF4261 domain-containing protein n=1 Tax=Aeoliella mucimassa TaxID=2527972 RepID=A0A518AGZ9_9BACT|nr:DUF4261 domain-containing protein [Aeoliella mucimassa]QDU54001.1 hypothetical protein Pan181_01810 [Aeoliella mucimassa]